MKNMSPSQAAHGNAGAAPGQMLAGMAEGSLKGCCGIAGIGSPCSGFTGGAGVAVELHRLGSRNAEAAEPGQLARMARSDARSDPMVASTADGS
jgi:hypothetical protein